MRVICVEKHFLGRVALSHIWEYTVVTNLSSVICVWNHFLRRRLSSRIWKFTVLTNRSQSVRWHYMLVSIIYIHSGDKTNTSEKYVWHHLLGRIPLWNTQEFIVVTHLYELVFTAELHLFAQKSDILGWILIKVNTFDRCDEIKCSQQLDLWCEAYQIIDLNVWLCMTNLNAWLCENSCSEVDIGHHMTTYTGGGVQTTVHIECHHHA
jgi:hypothetical protein